MSLVPEIGGWRYLGAQLYPDWGGCRAGMEGGLWVLDVGCLVKVVWFDGDRWVGLNFRREGWPLGGLLSIDPDGSLVAGWLERVREEVCGI